MANDAPRANRLKALDILKASEAHPHLSHDDRTNLEDAIEHDLDTASASAALDKERIATLEGQMHAVAEAIVAIA